MSDNFIRIASFTNVWEAELARNRLADEQIPAFLGNATLVSWVWYYSNAVGGVTVHVARRDADVATRIVTPICTDPTKSQPSWACPSCNAIVSGSWSVCWQCGTSADGSQALLCAVDETPPESAVESEHIYGSTILAIFVVLVLLILLLCVGPVLILAALPFVACFVILLQAIGGETTGRSLSDGAEELESHWPHAPTPKQSFVAKAIVLRAWRSALLGFFIFPPLGLYSLWLVYRLAGRSTPLSGIDRLRCRVAVILDLFAIVFVVLLFVLPLLVLSYSVTSFISQFFGFASGVH